MAGAALTVGFGTFTTSFIQSLNEWSAQIVPGDLFVTAAPRQGSNARNTPLAGDFRRTSSRCRCGGGAADAHRRDRLPRLSGQAAVDRHGAVRALRSTCSKAAENEVLGKLRRGAVYISENMSHRFDLHAATTIALGTARARDVRDRRGRGRLHQRPRHGHDGPQDLPRRLGRRSRRHLRAAPGPGASIEKVRGTINERYGEQRALFVLTNREFRGEFEKRSTRSSRSCACCSS